MGQSCPAQTLVAQVSNLPYRGFPIRRRRETPVSQRSPAVSRLEVGDTADWRSALQPGETDPLRLESHPPLLRRGRRTAWPGRGITVARGGPYQGPGR